jgi:hypothetical protein
MNSQDARTYSQALTGLILGMLNSDKDIGNLHSSRFILGNVKLQWGYRKPPLQQIYE